MRRTWNNLTMHSILTWLCYWNPLVATPQRMPRSSATGAPTPTSQPWRTRDNTVHRPPVSTLVFNLFLRGIELYILRKSLLTRNRTVHLTQFLLCPFALVTKNPGCFSSHCIPKCGQLYFSKASNSVSDHLNFRFPDFLDFLTFFWYPEMVWQGMLMVIMKGAKDKVKQAQRAAN